ncbi:MAG: phage head closure protein [Bacteroidales bacterium]|nr:phage head closure protein [Bacteroidales bacterium]
MNPGRLRHRITFSHLVEGENEVGDTVLIEEPFKTVWASVEPLKGRDYFEARKIQSAVTHKIIIRYLSGITPDMKIDFKGRIFEIEGPQINPEERNKYLELYAVEKVS